MSQRNFTGASLALCSLLSGLSSVILTVLAGLSLMQSGLTQTVLEASFSSANSNELSTRISSFVTCTFRFVPTSGLSESGLELPSANTGPDRSKGFEYAPDWTPRSRATSR